MTALRVLLVAAVLVLVQAATARSERVILFLGDSITAGLGVRPEEAYPARVGELLRDRGFTDLRIVNAGVAGSTSAGAESRLRWYERLRPAIIVLALGANDGLRGLSTREMEENLDAVIRRAREQHIRVLLAGMEVPPNYGDDYARSFREVFRDLAARHPVRFLPFLLDGVGGVTELNQDDGIHPNARGHRRIAALVAPLLARMLEENHDP